MTLRECYDRLGEDYYEVLSRLGSEARVDKYIRRVIGEGYMESLETAMAEKNYEEAFRAAHSMKGMCYNLGLRHLGDASSVLCETMRNGAPDKDNTPLLENLRLEYASAKAAIEMLDSIAG